MSVLVKICGLMRPSDCEAAVEAGADFVGVVFAESRRQQTRQSAIEILASMPKRTGRRLRRPPKALSVVEWYRHRARQVEALFEKRRTLVVGVFDGVNPGLVMAYADTIGLDLAQIGPNDPWDDAHYIGIPVIKAIQGSTTSFDAIEKEPSICLLDGDRPGSGEAFDWRPATALAAEMPIMLAGGLTADNVGEAVRTVQPWAVDVSSGVEVDGRKDPELMKRFVAAAKGSS
ncbi:MAG: hypothetical protein GEU28_06890 [Dehalococcoidia bacterium]|nr:hypothetical protein [Dehalococcoidia bacterium]